MSVAVVIPCFDNPTLAVDAIGSARAAVASLAGRVVVVDDGSTHPEMPTLLADLDGCADVVVIRRPSNGGHLRAVADGVAWVDPAEFPVVCFLDADDRHFVDWPARAAAEFAADDDVVLVGGRPRVIDADGRPIAGRTGRLAKLPSIQRRLASGDVVPLLERRNWYEVPTTSGLALRTRVLHELCAHLPDERGWFDTWVAAAAPYLGTVRGLDAVAFDYRLHGDNVLGETGDLELVNSSRHRRAAWANEWAERTGRPGRVDGDRDPRVVLDRFAGGERVAVRDRGAAVLDSFVEARLHPPAAGAALVVERLLRASSRSLGRRIAAVGLGRAIVELTRSATTR
ncbi:MAG: glycosyltransferase family 2 protein [Acidimicrobiales bacterium]